MRHQTQNIDEVIEQIRIGTSLNPVSRFDAMKKYLSTWAEMDNKFLPHPDNENYFDVLKQIHYISMCAMVDYMYNFTGNPGKSVGTKDK